MILQIDPRLREDKWWAESGCGLMSVFFLVNKFTNFPFDIPTILELGRQFRKHQLVTEEFYILDWEGLFRFFPGMGHTVYTNRHEDPGRICRENEFEILDWYNPKMGKMHLTPGDGRGRPTYDSMGQSVTLRDGFLRSKRIFLKA